MGISELPCAILAVDAVQSRVSEEGPSRSEKAPVSGFNPSLPCPLLSLSLSLSLNDVTGRPSKLAFQREAGRCRFSSPPPERDEALADVGWSLELGRSTHPNTLINSSLSEKTNVPWKDKRWRWKHKQNSPTYKPSEAFGRLGAIFPRCALCAHTHTQRPIQSVVLASTPHWPLACSCVWERSWPEAR